jgi:hypothetical protein
MATMRTQILRATVISLSEAVICNTVKCGNTNEHVELQMCVVGMRALTSMQVKFVPEQVMK